MLAKSSDLLENITRLLRDPRLFREQAYVNGRWCSASGGAVAEVTNPATGRSSARCPIWTPMRPAKRSKRRRGHGRLGGRYCRRSAAGFFGAGAT